VIAQQKNPDVLDLDRFESTIDSVSSDFGPCLMTTDTDGIESFHALRPKPSKARFK
jgi:hypothetical protein